MIIDNANCPIEEQKQARFQGKFAFEQYGEPVCSSNYKCRKECMQYSPIEHNAKTQGRLSHQCPVARNP